MTKPQQEDRAPTRRLIKRKVAKKNERKSVETADKLPVDPDVKFYPRNNVESGIFEDWWINPLFFDEDIYSKGGEGLLHDECVAKL